MYGLNYYVLQCVQGLAGGPAGPYYQHREGARYLHDFWMGRLMNHHYRINPVPFPDYFPKLTINNIEKYGLEEFKQLCVYQKMEGMRDMRLQRVCRYKFYVYLCNVYGRAMRRTT